MSLSLSLSAGRTKSRHGFALVITIALLAFLVLLLTSLALLAKVEVQLSDNLRKLEQARGNALLALNLAVGQLQQYAGPDQRATARGELAFANARQPYLAGVWDTSCSPPQLLAWLVSGNENNGWAMTPNTVPAPAFAADVTQVQFVGAKSVSGSSQAVVLRKEPIVVADYPGLTGNQTVGHYSYWVSDEVVKASAAVFDTLRAALGSPAVTNYPRIRLQTFYSGVDPQNPATATALGKVLFYSQLAFAGATPSSLKATFHQVTSCAYGVPSNPADGGLKLDRSYSGGICAGNPYYDGANYRLNDGFFSQNPPVGTDPDQLPVARFQVVHPDGASPLVTDLQGVLSGRHLLVAGAFNIHSLSATAWQAVLEGARTKQWCASAAGAHGVAGSRSLSDAQLAALANAIVARLRQGFPVGKAANTPFASLNDFASSGLLQASLDATTINVGKTPGVDPDHFGQNDVLALLAPVLTTRSDTFLIRAYGDVQNPVTSTPTSPVIEGRAWCEAVVQRVPDYVDASQDPATPPSVLNATNRSFGRRFRVVTFRWLSPDDI